jgi:PKD repeat protein
MIGFNKTCHEWGNRTNGLWNWGDHSTKVQTNDDDMGWRYHQYRNPGTYQVTYTRGTASSTPWCNNVDSRTIVIRENRYLETDSALIQGSLIEVSAVNFNTPDNIYWDMGDGTIYKNINRKRPKGGSVVSHTYSSVGTFTIKAYDWDGDTSTTAVTMTITLAAPARRLDVFLPARTVRVDQMITFEAVNFVTNKIDWNFGNGDIRTQAAAVQTIRYQNPGTFTVTAKDSGINHAPVSATVTILPENRRIEVSASRINIGEATTVDAINFRGDFVLWNFGDGTVRSDFHSVTHTYSRPGNYTIVARDENGESQKEFTAQVTVIGINDTVTLEVAELRFDTGKYYKVVPKNSRGNRVLFQTRFKGTGIVTGYFLVDGHPFENFNRIANQGELIKIYSSLTPGLPTISEGMHTVSVRLLRPDNVQVDYPVLKYFVLPYENTVKILTPKDGFITKEKEIPKFTWEEPRGGTKYKITFSNYLYPLLQNRGAQIQWIDLNLAREYTPTKAVWDKITRNKWTYWKVRSYDNTGNILAESDVVNLKVVIATADIKIARVTDMDGNEINLTKEKIRTRKENIMVHGKLAYKGNSKYIVLRVYQDNRMVDQLVFRDVKQGDELPFNTSLQNLKKTSRVLFKVLKTSSPALVIGIKGLELKRK